MKITCHSCAAKYTVSDDKVAGKTVKMKCRKCGATIVVGGASGGEAGAVSDDAALAGGGADGVPAGSYMVNVSESDQRTMTTAEIVDAYNQGVVTGDTYVWAEGMADWQALSENTALVAALHGAAGEPGGAGAATPAAQPAYAAPAYQAPEPAYQAPEPAYAAAAVEAPRAAARREVKPAHDIFSTGASSAGASASYSAPSASASSAGKREENSVLFSLSALTATSAPAARSSSTSATKDDSGLIDLKALAASAPAASADTAPTPLDTIGLFPLGAPVLAPPPTNAPVVTSMAAEPAKASKLPMVIGVAGALALIVGVFFIVKGTSAPPAPSATAAAPPPTVTAALPAAPSAEPLATATAEPSASASASAVAAAPTGYKRPTGALPKPTSGGAAASTGAAKPTTTAPAAPPRSNCGCAPSDLNCAMKCAAGKKK